MQKWWFYAFWEFKGLNLVPIDWTNAILMLVQRRRRWANIKTALVQGVVFAGVVVMSADPVNTERSPNAVLMLAINCNAEPTMCQHYINALCLAGG